MNKIETVSVLGFQVARVDYVTACEWIFEKAEKADRAYAVEAANTHVLALGRQESDFGAAISKFDLLCPDGMPLVWAINRTLEEGEQLESRVYGPTLMLEALERSASRGLKHFVLGGKEETLAKLAQNIQKQYPDTTVAGYYSPPFGPWPENEFEKISQKIKDSGASLVWVGLGCPKQERWIAENLESLPPAVYFGIGAAIAFHAGEVKQAPGVFQRMGFEWLFRLVMEPKRLWKRYAVYNSLFVYYFIKDLMFEPDSLEPTQSNKAS